MTEEINRNCISISIRGDLALRSALREVAQHKDMQVGDLVREAVNRVYGDDLRPYLAFFAAQSGTSNDQIVSNSTTKRVRKVAAKNGR